MSRGIRAIGPDTAHVNSDVVMLREAFDEDACVERWPVACMRGSALAQRNRDNLSALYDVTTLPSLLSVMCHTHLS